MAGYPITPQTAQIAIEEAGERTYGQAVRHLAHSHGIRMGKELLENLTQTVGEYWLFQDRQKVVMAQSSRMAPSEQFSADKCLIFADGVMVHSEGDWHEARVGTVRSSVCGEKPFKSSIARLCSLDEFGEDLWRHACELGYRSASLTAFIGDGSHWLWNLADRHFHRAIKIVDFWHACEHVSSCAAAFFGEGSEESRQWSLQLRGHLRAGDVEGALHLVEQLNPRNSHKSRQQKHSLITYLTNNRNRMDYPRYEALGLPIGSGEVEAQCKTLVQARCKQAGMRWSSTGIERLLRVRCSLKDGRYWRQFGKWPDDLAVWQTRKKREQRAA